MLLGIRHVPDIAVLALAMLLQDFAFSRLFSAQERSRLVFIWVERLGRIVLVAGMLLVLVQSVADLPDFGAKGLIVWWALALIAAAAAARFFPPIPEHPERRLFLSTTGRVAVAAPLLITGVASAWRKNFQISEVNVPIPGLPKDLDGLRIVQLTDIHLGPFLQREDLAKAISMANGLQPHLAVITGDLITSKGDPLNDALHEISRLRTDAGIFGCHGNHEIYARAESYATAEGKKLGMRFLRQENAELRFGSASVNLVGVDYQKSRRPYLVNTEKLLVPGNVNILLSHNPDVFPVARHKGFALTLAGHTHGGQVNFEILHRHMNVASFFTPYTKGLYTEGSSSIYVSAGIGTVGVPVRLGAPPEVTLIRLCAT